MVSGAKRSVHVVVLAGRTPVGLIPETSAAQIRAGLSRVSEHPCLLDPCGEPLSAAWDLGLDPEQLGWQRLLMLAEATLEQLGERIAATRLLEVGRPSLLLALPEHRPGWTTQHARSTFAALTARELPRLPGVQIEDVARGHAGGLYGIAIASDRIRSGAADWCIVGGVDSYLDAETLRWLGENRQLKSAATRSSFYPGEAASFVVLAAGELVRQLGLRSLAMVAGAGIAEEPARIKSDAISLGRGLAAAVASACEPIARTDRRVDEVYCDINGERYRSEEWGFALLETQELLLDGTDYHMPASYWGDVGAASGALFVTLAARAWARDYARGPSALAWAGSENGLRAAVAVTHPGWR